jgi:hypothetical protein
MRLKFKIAEEILKPEPKVQILNAKKTNANPKNKKLNPSPLTNNDQAEPLLLTE